MDSHLQSSFAHANQVASAGDQVPWLPCDQNGFIVPDSSEDRVHAAYSRSCNAPVAYDPHRALKPAPRRPCASEPPKEVLEAALGSLWVRERKMCRDPRGFNVDKKIASELYPVPASTLRDSRPPLQVVGAQTRFDGRDPVATYKKLGYES